MLVDANLLVYATDVESPHHPAASAWLEAMLNGERRVALPWLSLAAFLRIMTNPRTNVSPLAPALAWDVVDAWLAADATWIPEPTSRHASILGTLVARHDVRGNLVTDAQLAALAIEHGLKVCSADPDFARFSEIEWLNPVAR